MFSLPVTYYAYSRTHANFSHTICCIASGLLRGRFGDVTHRSHATLPRVLRNVPKDYIIGDGTTLIACAGL